MKYKSKHDIPGQNTQYTLLYVLEETTETGREGGSGEGEGVGMEREQAS